MIQILGAGIASLGSILVRYLTPMLAMGVVKTLGIVAITFVGADLAIDALVEQLEGLMDGIGDSALDAMEMFGIFEGMQYVLTAWVAGFQIRQMRGMYKSIKALGLPGMSEG